jgi:hypothetical protein
MMKKGSQQQLQYSGAVKKGMGKEMKIDKRPGGYIFNLKGEANFSKDQVAKFLKKHVPREFQFSFTQFGLDKKWKVYFYVEGYNLDEELDKFIKNQMEKIKWVYEGETVIMESTTFIKRDTQILIFENVVLMSAPKFQELIQEKFQEEFQIISVEKIFWDNTNQNFINKVRVMVKKLGEKDFPKVFSIEIDEQKEVILTHEIGKPIPKMCFYCKFIEDIPEEDKLHLRKLCPNAPKCRKCGLSSHKHGMCGNEEKGKEVEMDKIVDDAGYQLVKRKRNNNGVKQKEKSIINKKENLLINNKYEVLNSETGGEVDNNNEEVQEEDNIITLESYEEETNFDEQVVIFENENGVEEDNGGVEDDNGVKDNVSKKSQNVGLTHRRPDPLFLSNSVKRFCVKSPNMIDNITIKKKLWKRGKVNDIVLSGNIPWDTTFNEYYLPKKLKVNENDGIKVDVWMNFIMPKKKPMSASRFIQTTRFPVIGNFTKENVVEDDIINEGGELLVDESTRIEVLMDDKEGEVESNNHNPTVVKKKIDIIPLKQQNSMIKDRPPGIFVDITDDGTNNSSIKSSVVKEKKSKNPNQFIPSPLQTSNDISGTKSKNKFEIFNGDLVGGFKFKDEQQVFFSIEVENYFRNGLAFPEYINEKKASTPLETLKRKMIRHTKDFQYSKEGELKYIIKGIGVGRTVPYISGRWSLVRGTMVNIYNSNNSINKTQLLKQTKIEIEKKYFWRGIAGNLIQMHSYFYKNIDLCIHRHKLYEKDLEKENESARKSKESNQKATIIRRSSRVKERNENSKRY